MTAQAPEPSGDRIALGVTLMLPAAVLPNGLSASAKWLASETALPDLQVATLRYGLHFVLVAVVFFFAP